MEPQRRRTGWMVWGGLFLLVATLLLAFLLAQLKLRMQRTPLPVYGQVAEFTLTNQNGKAVSLADLRGRVWVADIIFTRCPGPCRRMTRRMKELQELLPANNPARLVTLTTDPDFDTPAVLKKYAEGAGADPNRWMFLTGSQTNIAKLATDSLKLAAVEKKPEERESANDLFVHSTYLVLVDQQGQLRSVLQTEGEGIDSTKVARDAAAIVRRLER